MFELYTTPLSANGRKVQAVAGYLGLEPALRLVNVYRGEGRAADYLAIHPMGKIPALVDDELTLWESNAIFQYMSEAYGDYRLGSRDPRQRADINRWLFWEASQWQPSLLPVLGPCVAYSLRPEHNPKPTRGPDWENAGLQPLLTLLESHLAGRGEGATLAGDGLSLGDFALAGMTTYLRAFEFPFSKYPAFAAWYERIERLPAWRDTAVPLWS